jgi:poly(A) polymerase
LDEFLARLRHPLFEHIVQLLPAEVSTYLVGGAVRDMLLGRPSFDLDFVTDGDALKISRQLADDLGGAYFPLDSTRNVARVILRPKDTSNSKSIKVDISRFQGADLQQDLQARDFTINAIAVDVHHLDILIDPLHGAEDLLAKRLRACAKSSLLADPVRILRAVRFSVELDLHILPETIELLRHAIPLLPEISAERLRDELFRILSQSRPSTALRILDKLGALNYILPEVCYLKDVKQGVPHVMDVWEHTLDILNRMEALFEVLAPVFDPEKAGNLSLGSAVLQLGRYRQKLSEHLQSALNPERPHRGLIFLSAIYHDVGKMATRSVDSKGMVHFYRHEQIGSHLAEKRGQALRLSNMEINRLVTIVNHHMRPSLLSHPEESPSKMAIYRFFKDTGVAGVDICLLSLADVLATYGPTLPQERWDRHLQVVRSLLNAWWEDKDEKVLPPALVNGDDLISEFNISAGPMIGYVLESVREAQVDGQVRNRAEALELARKIIGEDLNNKGGTKSSLE